MIRLSFQKTSHTNKIRFFRLGGFLEEPGALNPVRLKVSNTYPPVWLHYDGFVILFRHQHAGAER